MDMELRQYDYELKTTIESLRKELHLKETMKRYNNCDKAQDSDQYQTPHRIIEYACKQYDYTSQNFWDTCDFHEDFNSEFFFDALQEDWPKYKDIFSNPAWSQNALFML